MLTLAFGACEHPSVTALAARAYSIRVSVPLRREAASLEQALAGAGAQVERAGNVVTAVWGATEADDVERWDDYTFTELVFFLRSWAGTDPARRLEILEERVL
jgi:hypothetical protein